MNDQNSLDGMNGHPLCVERCRRNLTQAQLADAVKVGITTIWRAENDYPISAASRQRICAYLNMTSLELGLTTKKPKKGTALVSSEASTISTASQAFPFIITKQSQPLDRVFEHTADSPSEQHIGAWLALESCNIASLFDAGWTLDAILDSLRVVLQGVEGIPMMTRRRLLQLGGMAAISGLALPTGEKITEEERVQLCDALGTSITSGWNMFHTAGNDQVLVIGQTQLFSMQQVHSYLDPLTQCAFYSAIYNLIGASYFFQGRQREAWFAHEKAHIAALEGADTWGIAQSLNWKSSILYSQNQHDKAIQAIEAALRLVDVNEEKFVRLKAHLLAQWAINASILHDNSTMNQKLASSERFLSQMGPNEEFDASYWYHVSGMCALTDKNHARAVEYLEQALNELPQSWLIRRFMTLIPLIALYAYNRNRDACIVALKDMSSVIHIKDARTIKTSFASIRHFITDAFPHDDHIHSLL